LLYADSTTVTASYYTQDISYFTFVQSKDKVQRVTVFQSHDRQNRMSRTENSHMHLKGHAVCKVSTSAISKATYEDL